MTESLRKLSRYAAFLAIASLCLTAASCRPSAPAGSTDTTGSDTSRAPELTKEPITLEYWRLFDDSKIFDSYIKDYQRSHPNINIEVKKIEITADYDIYDYQNDVIKLIADGGGPDIFMLHNTWLPYQKNQIAPVVSGQMSVATYRDTYPEVVQNDFIDNNRIYGIPYYIDNLMLFYNTDIFSQARIKQPPKTLAELADLVPILTQRDATGRITRSAISLGGTEGMPRSADILSALMMQYGAEMASADRQTATFNLPAPGVEPAYFAGREALTYYTQFADPTSRYYTFTDAKDSTGTRLFPSDIQAFMEGKSAMFIGYAYQVQNIRKFAPKLNFNTTVLPQLKVQEPANIAHYWGETVSKTSDNPNEAWDFIMFMSNKSNQSRLFTDANYVPARTDLIDRYSTRRYYGPVAQQVEYSHSWYRQNTATVESIFAKMIESVVKRQVAADVAIDVAVRDINALNRD
jgi:multiple sugar transport system substrate-binding protein